LDDQGFESLREIPEQLVSLGCSAIAGGPVVQSQLLDGVL
jgi:hypothetical protein